MMLTPGAAGPLMSSANLLERQVELLDELIAGEQAALARRPEPDAHVG